MCHVSNQTVCNVHVHYRLFLGLVSVLCDMFCVMYALLTGNLLLHLASVLCYNVCVMYTLLTGDLLSRLVCFVICFVLCKLCVMYALLTGDLLSRLVSVLCYMFVSCMLCSLATCFRVL